jgi:hypothetical protein
MKLKSFTNKNSTPQSKKLAMELGIKYKIEDLITTHKMYRDKVSWCLNEISSFDLDKLSFDEAEAFCVKERNLNLEYSIRSSFISDLENLL